MKTVRCAHCGETFETQCDGGFARCPHCFEVTTTDWDSRIDQNDSDPDDED